jgi:hypothetical protein
LQGCHRSPAGARRFFLAAEYHDQGFGLLEPQDLRVGPCGEGAALECDVVRQSWRPRKTGPCFPLLVMRCREHGRSFSVYPPGHVPYGRRALARVAFDGAAIVDAAGGAKPADGTLFEAAADAAAGVAWGREDDGTGSWSYQLRQMKRSAQLLGLTSPAPLADAAAVAELLAVDTLLVMEQRAVLAVGPGYVGRGAAVMKVFMALQKGPSLVDRLAEAGYQAGLWGQPYRWDARAQVLRSKPFRPAGARPGAGAPSG